MATLADRYIRRSLRINRAAVGEAAVSSKILREVIGRVNSIVDNVVNGRINRLEAEIRIQQELLEVYRGRLIPKIVRDAREIINLETAWVADTISDFTDRTIASSGLAAIFDRTQNQTYQGRTFSEWFEREGVRNVSAVNRTIRSSFIEGLSVAATQRAVENVIGFSDTHVRTLTRSNLLNASAEVRDDFLNENQDLIEGSIWNSTLDVRTTPHICGVRDQKRYDAEKNPIDHEFAYGEGPGRIHFNCRSIEIPILPGISTATAQRPAIGAGKEYERGDKFTRRGTVRKPGRREVNKGMFDITQRTNRTRFEGWLRSQPVSFIADNFGSLQRAREFKRGASLASVTGADPLGLPMNLSDL